MKKLLLLTAFLLAVVGLNAQSQRGEGSLMGSVGYQSNYDRFGIQAQGRYVIARNLRLAPDITFFFPKNKATGLDVNLNVHYVFNFRQDGTGFSVYPLAGIGMQNNFYGKRTITVNGVKVETDSDNVSKFAVNLGGGITLPISMRGYLNAEVKFMLADEDNVVFMLGYGHRF